MKNVTLTRIGVISKALTPDNQMIFIRLLEYLHQKNVAIVLEPSISLPPPLQSINFEFHSVDQMSEYVDWVIVLGGDGTLLRASRILAKNPVPIVGINLGTLGFLTDIPAEQLEQYLDEIFQGHFEAEERSLLSTTVYRNQKVIQRTLALNDVVLTKGARGSMIDMEVIVDGQFLYQLRADGLIVATPTGSSAYALSSGGPLLQSNLPAVALVPICPHMLSNRPIVISNKSTIVIRFLAGIGAFVNFDVQDQLLLEPNDEFIITTADQCITLWHPLGYSHYRVLREKLGWGHSYWNR